MRLYVSSGGYDNTICSSGEDCAAKPFLFVFVEKLKKSSIFPFINPFAKAKIQQNFLVIIL